MLVITGSYIDMSDTEKPNGNTKSLLIKQNNKNDYRAP